MKTLPINEKAAAQALDRLMYNAFAGVEESKPNPNFKPSYKTPQATIKVLREGVRTGDFKLVASCLTPQSAEKLVADLTKELESVTGDLNELGVKALEELAGLFLIPFENYKLGKLVSSTSDERVYEYSTAIIPKDTQTFKKIDGKWLLAD
jgi:hypothetical protein